MGLNFSKNELIYVHFTSELKNKYLSCDVIQVLVIPYNEYDILGITQDLMISVVI